MMDFVIEKKALDSAMKQVLFGRSGASEGLVDLKVERSMLALVAMGTNVEIPVTSGASGNVSITVGDLVKLKKVSATYKAGPCEFASGMAGFDFRTRPSVQVFLRHKSPAARSIFRTTRASLTWFHCRTSLARRR